MAEVPFLPPGPSPEFLRRQAMLSEGGPGTATLGSFDPATGVRESQAFSVPITPPATSEMQMMEAIRQQLNATRFKEQQKAYEAGVRFQHMREAERMREAGATEREIWGRLGLGMMYNNPSAYVSRMGQLTPAPDPQLTNFGGADAVIEGKNKTVKFIPRSAIAQEPFEPVTKIVDGEKVVKLSPNRWQLVNGDEPSPSVLRTIYKDEITDLKEDLETLPDNNRPDTVAQRTALQKQIAELRAKRKSLSDTSARPAATTLPMPKSKSELVNGQIYATPRGVATWDGDKFVK